MQVNQKAITGFLEENYKVIIFYIFFALGLFFFFYGLMSFFPGGGNAPGFFQSLDEQLNTETATAADKPSIMKNVDTIVADINNGKSATDIKPDVFSPFIAIMDAEGKMIVHPQYPGFNVRNVVPFIYNEIAKGTVDGVWVEYPSGGKLKHVYVKKTSNDLFVTSGYFK
jgi:hypothetical protein